MTGPEGACQFVSRAATRARQVEFSGRFGNFAPGCCALTTSANPITLTPHMTSETHWSILLLATLDGSPEGQRALEELCRRYRPPVERFIWGKTGDTRKAEEYAQGFFLKFLKNRLWQRADRTKGRFRNYLFKAVTYYLHDEHAFESAECRGGGQAPASLDEMLTLGFEPSSDSGSPGQIFDYQWAVQLLRMAGAALRASYQEEMEEFQVLERFLPGSSLPLECAEAAQLLGISEVTLRKKLSRLRQEFAVHFRGQVASTVEPHEVDEEVRYLLGLLMDPPSEM